MIPLPALADNLICRRDEIMAKQSIAKLKRVCKVEGCNNKIHARGYCGKHYAQLLRCGHILKRSLHDPNEIIVDGNICKIFLYNRKREIIAKTIIDLEDKEKIEDYHWYLKGGYAVSTSGQCLSKLILDTKSEIDHKNHNTLDNRKSNLRKCTQSQNLANSKIRIDNKSGFKGVSWDKGTQKWRAEIRYKKKRYHLGVYIDIIEATKAYNRKAKDLFGNFAFFNIIKEKQAI